MLCLSRRITVFFLLVVLSALTVNRFAPFNMNADTVFFSIMSIQHVTLFIWGQDRFANIVPFFLSVITNPYWNLVAHLIESALSYFLLLLLIAWLIARFTQCRRRGEDVLTIFLIAVAVGMLVLSPFAMHVFAVEGQPYALSYLMLLLAYCGFFHIFPGARLGMPIAIGSLVVGFGLNPSLLIGSAALAVGAFYFRKGWRPVAFFLAAAIIFSLWWAAPKLIGLPRNAAAYEGFSGANFDGDVHSALSTILAQVRIGSSLLIVLLLMLVDIALPRIRNESLQKVFSMLWFFSLVWLLVFSKNTWIKMNLSHFRYFFPCFFVLIIYLTLLIYQRTHSLSIVVRRWFAALLLISVMCYLIRPFVPMSEYRVFKISDPYTETAKTEEIKFIAGDYWVAWPVLFELLQHRGEAYGLLYRGEGNKNNTARAIDRELHDRGSFRVLCIKSPVSECIADVERITQRKWVAEISPNMNDSVILKFKANS